MDKRRSKLWEDRAIPALSVGSGRKEIINICCLNAESSEANVRLEMEDSRATIVEGGLFPQG